MSVKLHIKKGDMVYVLSLIHIFKLKSFDHNLVDKSAEKIVKTVKSTGAVVSGPQEADHPHNAQWVTSPYSQTQEHQEW